MILHFDQAKVRALLAHTLAAPKHRMLYGQRSPKPGLWLIAEDGVCLISNGSPPSTDPDHVVYADETDPKTVDPETMDAVKRQSSGGDDSAEFLDATTIETALATYRPDEPYLLDVTPEGVGFLAYKLVRDPVARARTPTKPARKRRPRLP